MIREEFIELLEKYRTGQLEEHAVLEFMRLVKKGQYDEELKEQILQVLQNYTADYGWTQADAAEVLARVLADMRQAKVVSAKRNRWRLAAAAIILALCGSSYLLFFRPVQRSPSAITTVSNLSGHDIGPGGNKAFLTLADGSKIVLDNAANGILVKQGAANVVKLDSGKLAYNIPNDAKPGEAAFNTITTPRGGQYQVILPDGSKVWLNAASSLRYPVSFAGLKQRMVSLTGEGYFEVAPSKSTSFVVQTNESTIQVLGTHFDVSDYPEDSLRKTTLLEGAVKVTEGTTEVVLRPGEEAQAKPDGGLTTVKDQDAERAIAWKNGVFDFDHTGLYSAMRQIARWYDVEVKYEGNVPNKPLLVYLPRSTKLSMILSFLRKVDVRCRMEGRVIYISP